VGGCGLAAALQTGPESFKNSFKLTCVKLKSGAISDMEFSRIYPVFGSFATCLIFGHCVAALAGKGFAGFTPAGCTWLSTEVVECWRIIFLCLFAAGCLFGRHPLAGRAKPRFAVLVPGWVHKVIHKIRDLVKNESVLGLPA
jgi:hypothetical protein